MTRRRRLYALLGGIGSNGGIHAIEEASYKVLDRGRLVRTWLTEACQDPRDRVFSTRKAPQDGVRRPVQIIARRNISHEPGILRLLPKHNLDSLADLVDHLRRKLLPLGVRGEILVQLQFGVSLARLKGGQGNQPMRPIQ